MATIVTGQAKSDLATTIWVEYFNEGEIDKIYPLKDLLNIDFINERIQTHLGIEDRYTDNLEELANDVQKLLGLRVQLLLKDFDIERAMKLILV